jgi:hypothetical protein
MTLHGQELDVRFVRSGGSDDTRSAHLRESGNVEL